MRHFASSVLFVSLAGSSGCVSLGTVTLPVEHLKAKYATSDDQYFSYRGLKVRYRDEGTGPVVILLHGVCSSLETWEGWARQLKGEFRVIRVDIPGFGLTGPAPETSRYSRDGAVEFLDDFAAHLEVAGFSIAGNSLGGYIAWNYAVAHPEKVAKLILVDPVGYHQEMPGLLAFASNPLIRPFSRLMMPRALIDKATSEVFGDKSKITPEISQRYFDFAMREGNRGSYIDVFTMMRSENDSPNLSSEIPNIKAPTLIMWGTKDEWIPPAHIDNWRRDLPTASFITFEGLGHVPMEEAPAMTAEQAVRFLR